MAQADVTTTDRLAARKSMAIKISLAVGLVLLLLTILFSIFSNLPSSPLRKAEATQSEIVTTAPVVEAPQPALGFSADERKALQQSLSDTKAQLEVLAADSYLSRWQATRFATLQEGVTQAYQLYGQQQYSDSAALLTQIQQQANSYQHDYTAAYQQAFQQAEAAFTQAELTSATLHIQQALNIKPDFEPAIQLQQRLLVAADVQQLWQQVRVAEKERNVAKQQTLLEQISQLDSADTAAAQQLAGLRQQQQQQQFSTLLANARTALEQTDYAKARQLLAQAGKIDSSRAELSQLQQQLAQAEQSNAVAQTLQQIQVFSDADEWPTVGLLASKALAAAPNNVQLQQYQQHAEQIVAASQQIAGYLQQPARLADSNIQQRAQAVISQASTLYALSPKLNAQSLQLQQQIQHQQQPVAVKILSDNRTYIKVLGVGVVGEVTEKTIQLPPGEYQLEGVCKGYQTEIISVMVRDSQHPGSVLLQCKTRI